MPTDEQIADHEFQYRNQFTDDSNKPNHSQADWEALTRMVKKYPPGRGIYSQLRNRIGR